MRILWISECPWNNTGFGKVTYYMTRELKKHGFDVTIACFATTSIINYDGINVYPYANPLNKFVEHIDMREGLVDIVVFHGSPWIIPLANILSQVPLIKDRKTIGYFVHEAEFIPSSLKQNFMMVHLLATPTKYTATVLGIDRYAVVNHGVNPDIWNPELTKNKKIAIVVGMVAKNHPRKRWDIFFDTVARVVKRGKHLAVLPYVTTDAYWYIGNIIESVAEYHNVKLNIIKPYDYETFFGLPEEEQAKILSMMDIHMLISMGEAWGLPVLETLAMGIPNIVTMYGAILEWCGLACNYIEATDYYYSVDGMIHPVPDKKLAEIELVNVLEHWSEYREKALRNSETLRKKYSWENVAKQMVSAIDTVQKYDDLIIDQYKEKIEVKPKVVEE